MNDKKYMYFMVSYRISAPIGDIFNFSDIGNTVGIAAVMDSKMSPAPILRLLMI